MTTTPSIGTIQRRYELTLSPPGSDIESLLRQYSREDSSSSPAEPPPQSSHLTRVAGLIEEEEQLGTRPVTVGLLPPAKSSSTRSHTANYTCVASSSHTDGNLEHIPRYLPPVAHSENSPGGYFDISPGVNSPNITDARFDNLASGPASAATTATSIYTTARSSSAGSTPRGRSTVPVSLPPITVSEAGEYERSALEGSGSQLVATRALRQEITSNQRTIVRNENMSAKINSHHNGHHNGARNGDRDQAAREPLIARSNDPQSQAKEESIRRKLKTYETILALKEGYMPTTEQLAAWARYALRTSGVLDSRNRRLSTKGREFVRDLRAWVEAVVDLGLGKNYDDKIQEFIWHTSHAKVWTDVPETGGATKNVVREGMSSTTMDSGMMLDKMRDFAGLLWSSPEFRGLISEFAMVGRDMFADAASTVASVASQAADSARSTDVDVGNKSPEEISRQAIKEKGVSYAEAARKSVYESGSDLESYLREKFPKQRRDAVINRMKKVVRDIQENSDFQETIDFIMDMMRMYTTKMKDAVAQDGKQLQGSQIKWDENLDVAMNDFKALLMAFANGKPLDPMCEAFDRVIHDIQSDDDLREFYSRVINEFDRLVTQKGYVSSDAADAAAHDLYGRSQELLNEKSETYRPHVERLFHEIRTFLEALRTDKETQRVIQASKKVVNDLIIVDNKTGAFKSFRKSVLLDLADVLLPRFINEIKFIPIPRIEYQDRDFDVILENVVLESEHFIPTRTIFEAFTRAEFTNTYTFNSAYTSTARIRLDDISLFAKDVAFIVRKKTGLLPFSDRGLIDVFMDHRGASADIILETNIPSRDDDEQAEDFFHVKHVNVTVHNFHYNYHAYHTWAAALLSPLIKPAVRTLLARILEQKITSAIETADREARAAVERMRVATVAGASMEGWIRAALSRPESKRRGHSARRGEWRVGVGAEDRGTLFPGEYATAGVGAKIGRAEERVHEGAERIGDERGWRNTIFDVRA